MTALPAWSAALSHTDRLKLTARLEMYADSPQEREKTLESWESRCTDPEYLVMRSVRGGSPLEPKDILPPPVSTQDDSPMEGFMKVLRWDQEYPTRGAWYADRQKDRIREWEQTVRAFEAKPNDFYNAWQYLNEHPVFWQFRGDDGMTAPEERVAEWNLVENYGIHQCVDIYVTKVHHATGWVEDNQDNTVTEIWIELGKSSWPAAAGEGDHVIPGETYPRDHSYHDPALDCGGATMESAIIAAAVNVHTHYGNDRRICDSVSSDG